MTEDVPRYPGVHRRPDSNIYQFGLRVPVDLRERFSTPWAVRCSLQTADIRAANAKAKQLQLNWEARFQALRAGQEPPQVREDSVDLQALRQALLTRIEASLPAIDARAAGMSADVRGERVGSAQWVLDSARDALDGGWIDDLGAEDWVAQLAPTRHPAALAEIQAARVLLSELFVEALSDTSRGFPLRVRKLQERRALLALSVGDAEAKAPQNGSRPSTGKAPHGHRIMDAFAVWEGKTRPAKTVSKFKSHAQQFRVLAHDPVLEDFTKQSAIKFRNDLELWAVSESKTVVTANNVLVSVRAIFTTARDQGWIEGNPFAGLVVKNGGKAGEGREPWTHDELRILFADPIWTEYRLPADRKAGQDAAYWIPLIACYTGARVSEIAQLWTDDLTVAPGAEVIEFRAKDERNQRLKNEGSWRAVPMHSELIRLGLCDYVASLPAGSLFPSLPTKGANGAGGQFSAWFGGFKTAKGFRSSIKTLHSFRHLVATELRLNGATDAQANAITGHAGQGVAGKVYAATIRQQAHRLRGVIELLKFPELDLPVTYGVAKVVQQ